MAHIIWMRFSRVREVILNVVAVHYPQLRKVLILVDLTTV